MYAWSNINIIDKVVLALQVLINSSDKVVSITSVITQCLIISQSLWTFHVQSAIHKLCFCHIA